MEYTDSAQDIEEIVKRQLADAGVITGDEDKSVAAGIKMNLGGKEYSFPTIKDAEDSLNTAFALSAKNQEELLAQISSQNSQQQVSNNSQQTAPTFDKDKWVDLMQKNPIEAMDYADDFSPKRQQLNGELNRLRQVEQHLESYKFLGAHPEYVNSDANAQKIRAIAGQLNLSMDFSGMNAAYEVGVARGIFQQQQQYQPQAQNQPQGRFEQTEIRTPPTFNRGGESAISMQTEAMLDKLTPQQLLDIMSRG